MTPGKESGAVAVLDLDEFVVRFTQSAMATMRLGDSDPRAFFEEYESKRRSVLDAPPPAWSRERLAAAAFEEALALVRADRRGILERADLATEELRVEAPPPFGRGELNRRHGGYPFLAELARRLAALPEVAGAVLHGSYATFEAIPYSDLDLLAILKGGALEDPSTLRRVRRALVALSPLLAAIDPVSHHGVQVLSEDDLLWHPEPRFPLVLFERGRSLVPPTGPFLIRRLFDNAGDGRRRLLRILESLAERFPVDLSRESAPSAKSWISRILLVPALALAAADLRAVAKKDSFALARSRWPELDWGVVDAAGSLRLAWRSGPVLLRPLAPRLVAGLPASLADLATRVARRAARELGRVPGIAGPGAFAARVRAFARSLGERLFSADSR